MTVSPAQAGPQNPAYGPKAKFSGWKFSSSVSALRSAAESNARHLHTPHSQMLIKKMLEWGKTANGGHGFLVWDNEK